MKSSIAATKASVGVEALAAEMVATYSPDDNKLRLYVENRLDPQTYEDIKNAGFIWAPKQRLFVAPAWTPERESLLLQLCGGIGDEDTTLMQRQEDRAARFTNYSHNRLKDAARLRSEVAKIQEKIPLGQPILVGHHSEGRARRDQKRIEDGMRHVVVMWSTAEYWQRRARGALHLAAYKQLPQVRHRRIKRIEADLRKQDRLIAHSKKALKPGGCKTCRLRQL